MREGKRKKREKVSVEEDCLVLIADGKGMRALPAEVWSRKREVGGEERRGGFMLRRSARGRKAEARRERERRGGYMLRCYAGKREG